MILKEEEIKINKNESIKIILDQKQDDKFIIHVLEQFHNSLKGSTHAKGLKLGGEFTTRKEADDYFNQIVSSWK